MTTPAKGPTPGPGLVAGAPAARAASPLATTAELLQGIDQMVQRISGYAQFMSLAVQLSGTSAEAKDKAVADFYDQMVILDRRLSRIQENLRLG